MTRSKTKTFLISFLLAALAVCLFVAFAACKGGEDKSAGKYGAGEEGIYYYDRDDSTEYLMTLQSGTYMISADGAKGYSGTYSYDEGTAISFKSSEGETFAAAFSDDAMQLEITGTPYTFLKKVDYTVKFMDGGTSVASETVTYGKKASAADGEKDGYIFLGWYEDAAFTTKYGFNTAVTGDLTLYAYYIKEDSTIANFEVQFVSGGEVVYTTTTQNGIVYDIPDADGVLGWWVSATNDGSELTYEYGGETLTEATKLFAVKSYALGASVYGDGLRWKTSVSSATIEVDGEVVATGVTGTSYPYGFDSLATGRHEITLTGSGASETLVYVTNALSRVSTFSVYGTTLVYNRVENAQYYYVSVECGNPNHSHEMVYNGNTLTYDFSTCEMGPEGIRFTVYAYGTGYAESVSDTFVYALILDGTTVRIDASSDTASWTPVAGASGYEVYVNGELVATVTDTEYSFKNENRGTEIEIAVKPVAPGYYSEISGSVNYTKSTLKAPEIVSVSGYEISWEKIDGAVSYELNINGYLVAVEPKDDESEAPATYVISDTALGYIFSDARNAVSVTAIAQNSSENSQQGDITYVTDAVMSSALSYADGIITWDYALAADAYTIELDGSVVATVSATNTYDVTFTHSGESEIKVYFDDSSFASLSVYAYAVIFNSEGGDVVDTIYVARGDTLVLETPIAGDTVGEFLGWYTLPNPDGMSLKGYTGDGVLVSDGTVFTGNGTLILYACWDAVRKGVTLVAGDYGAFEDGGTEAQYDVPMYVSGYTIPVPEGTDAAYVFYGWYSEEGGIGTQYTNYDGSSKNNFNNSNITTLYAYWIEVLEFDTETYDRQAYASVSAGRDIALAPEGEVTVPSEYEIDGTVYTVGVIGASAFNNCTVLRTLNIPDTVVYISTVNNGSDTGSGAFSGCSSLRYVNVYAVEEDANTTREIEYYSYDGVLYEKGSDDGARLIYYPKGKKDAQLIIPEYVVNDNEYRLEGGTEVKVVRPVTEIADKVFYVNSSFTSVVIPATVTKIDMQAFQQCTKLASVTFADSVSSGEVSAAATLTIASKAFERCTALENVMLPSRLAAFDTNAFDGCSSFKYVSIADGGTYSSYEGMLYSNDNTVFYCPRAREDEIVWKNGVTRIAEGAFADCTKLTSVAIPTTVTYIGVNAFSGCTAVTSLDFGDRSEANPLTIDARAFYGCTRLTEVILPLGVETIGTEAFAGCTRLTYVYYDCAKGSTAEYLDFAEGAFGTSVTTLEFGANVPLIENFVLVFGSGNLTAVIIDENNPSYTGDTRGVIYGNYGAGDTILMWTPALTGSYTTLDGCTAIGAEAFKDRTSLMSVTISASVAEIGQSAFYGCTNLGTVTFAAGSALLTIADYAFAASGLTTITIPASVEYIGEYAGGNLAAIHVFDDCASLTAINVEEGNECFAATNGILYAAEDGIPTQLVVCPRNNSTTEIVIPSTVIKIWDNAFYNTTIKKVTFEDGEVDGDFEFGDSVFYGSSLEEIDLPVGLTAIPAMLFERCSYLTTVTVPYTVTKIGGNAFYYCTALTSVTFDELPAGASLSDYPLTFEDSSSYGTTYGTFYQCGSLTAFDFPDRTVSVGAQTLAYCGALKTVTIGSEMTEIPSRMFRSDYELTTVNFGHDNGNAVKLTTLSSEAFTYCGKEAEPMALVLPSSVTTIGNSCFVYCYLATITLNEGLETISDYAFGNSNSSSNRTSFTTINIPSTVESIGNFAFVYSPSLQSVTFAENSKLELISDSAFRYCYALTTITLPASLGELGQRVFESCKSLTSVTFATETDNSKDTYGYSSMKKFGDYTFQSCTSLGSFAFPETKEECVLGSSMFMGCKNLTHITLSSEMTTLGTALSGCYSITSVDTTKCKYLEADETSPVIYSKTEDGTTKTLILVYGDVSGEFTVDAAVTAIDAGAFATQLGLISLKLPVTLTNIGNYAFDGCLNLSSVEFYAVEGVTQSGLTVGDFAFRQTAITEFDFSGFESVDLGRATFAYCEKLTEITMTGNFTLVEGEGSAKDTIGTFGYATGLETVILGGLTEIPAYTFYGCSALRTIAQSEDTLVEGEFDLSGIKVGAGAFNDAAVEKIVMSLGTALPAGNTSTSYAVFNGCKYLTTIIYGDMASFPSYQFYSCTALKCVGSTESDLYVEGNPVVDLTGTDATGTYLFYSCTGIEAVVIDPTKPIGQAAFYSCSGLKTVAQKVNGQIVYESGVANFEGITISGTGAFYGAGITEVKLSSSTSLPAGTGGSYSGGAFISCTSLTDVDFGGLTAIPAYTFHSCSALVNVTNYGSITSIGDYAFYSCSKLVTLPCTGLVTVGQYAFNGCSALTTIGEEANVVDLSSLTSLGIRAFYGCSKIVKVILPSVSLPIGEYMFYQCTALTTIGETEGVVDLSSIASLGERAFQGCTAITTVILPTGITVPTYAFYNCTALVAIATDEDGLCVGEEPVINLTGITIGSSASNCFRGCSKITTLILGGNTTLPTTAFYGCTLLSTVAKTAQDVVAGTADLSGVAVGKAVFYGTAIEKVILSSTSSLEAGTGTTTDSGVFAECKSLTTIILNGFTNVTLGSFYNCTALKSVADTEEALEWGVANLSDLSMGIAAFANTGIEKIIMNSASSVTAGTATGASASKSGSIAENTSLTEVVYGADTMPAYTFSGCTKLTTLAKTEASLVEGVINLEGITATGDYTFYNCTSITEVVLGDNEVVGASAFYGCTNLVTVGDTYRTADLSGVAMCKAAFASSGIESVILSETSSLTAGTSTSAANLGVFATCGSLTTVDLGGIDAVTAYTFYNCKALTTVTGAEGLTTVENRGFYGCEKLEGLAATSVSVIGSNAFNGCSSFTFLGSSEELINLDTVTSLASDAFAGCTSIKGYEVTNSDYYEVMDDVLYSTDGELLTAPGSVSGVITILDGVTVIGESAFDGNTNITEVVIPESVVLIDDDAFYGCSNLTKVTIEGNAVTIGEDAFCYCANLEEVVTTGGVGTLGAWAFEYCSSLKSIEISGEAASIGNYAFAYDSALAEVEIHDGVSSIGQYAFRSCTTLETVTIPYTVTNMGNATFKSSTSLSEVVFEDVPEGEAVSDYLLTIETSYSSGYGPFDSCSALKTIELPDRLTQCGYYLLASLNLESATINGTGLDADTLGQYTFNSCTSLKSVTIGNGVEAISSNMFYGCTALTEVIIPDSVTTIGTYAFRGCTALTSLVIPDSVDSMGDYAFYDFTASQTVYIAASYTYATLMWITYNQGAAISTTATKESWKNNSNANYAYYMEKPETADGLFDLGVTYWYYGDGGEIVEWTLAELGS